MANTFRIKRRPAGGAAGAPPSLVAAELAYNEQDDVLYYGKGNSAGLATSIIPIGGPGAFTPVGGGGGETSTTISDTPPASPTPGSMWWESDSGTLWIYYNDGNTSQWVAAAGGSSVVQPGALVQIARVDVSSAVAQVDFTSGIDATYDEYEVHAYGVQVSAVASIILRISQDGGATFKAGASDYAFVNAGATATASSWAGGGGAGTQIAVTYQGINNTALASANFVTRFAFPSSTTLRKVFMSDAAGVDGTGAFRSVTSGVYGTNTGAINAIRFLASTGNITAGTFILYGIKK